MRSLLKNRTTRTGTRQPRPMPDRTTPRLRSGALI